MQVRKKTTYDINDVPKIFVDVVTTVLLNSNRNSLNQYLESRGGRPGLISEEEWKEVCHIATKIHEETRRR